MCGWPFGAHEQAWLKQQAAYTQMLDAPSKGASVLTIGNGTVGDKSADPKWGGYGNYSSREVKKIEPHKIYKGRKFRDADNEGV